MARRRDRSPSTSRQLVQTGSAYDSKFRVQTFSSVQNDAQPAIGKIASATAIHCRTRAAPPTRSGYQSSNQSKTTESVHSVIQ